jgi:K+-sensing histidine kinase KdpD
MQNSLLSLLLLEQVLVILLENAIKYSASDSPINLSAWAEDQKVIVEVADPALPRHLITGPCVGYRLKIK